MIEKRQRPEELRIAIEEETKRFEEFYLWLQASMPNIFFKEVSPESISLIVHSLAGFKEQEYFSEIHLKQSAISLCIDTPEADLKILKGFPLYGIKNFTTYVSLKPLPFPELEGKFLRIATINFTEFLTTVNEPLPHEMVKEIEKGFEQKNKDLPREEIDLLISKIDSKFLRQMRTDRQILALEMFHRATTRDLCQYEVQYEKNWQEKETYSMHIVLAWRNTPKHNFLYRLADVVFRHGLVMKRVNAAYTDPYTTESIFLLSFGLHGANNEAAWDAADIVDFLQELATLKYFGSADLFHSTFVSTGLLRGNLANLLRAMTHFIHQVVVNIDIHQYTLDNIIEGLCRHPELTMMLCDAFEFKFHPNKSNLDKFESLKDKFIDLVSHLDTGNEENDMRRRNILLQGMNFITHTLKNNFYRNNKSALAFRLDPKYLDYAPFERKRLFPESPFGIFFIKGMHYIAFHVRFRDLARGGLRTVYPEKKERMIAERNVVFLECYNLAYTQQKKNKDIPEGGAKGIIFLKPYERLAAEAEILQHELKEAKVSKEEIANKIDLFREEQKLEYLYQTQRSFIKNLLLLVNCEEDGKLKAKDIVDYWKKPEYIYLGPDENLNNAMIEWIAKESKKEHYKPGVAFISGKPGIGINHKEYGVTSLGVNVYMKEVLRFLGMDPAKDPFTVKITGGPDGDVAGNQILNLYRFYPRTAKLVALTDISGTIFDPQGLDLAVCAKLFEEQKAIRFYPPEKLSEGGFLLDKEIKREPTPYTQQTLCYKKEKGVLQKEWLSGNETNHLYRHNVHQAKADIFIPAGGRPRTLNEINYRDFLDAEGKPTSKAIVEGANLYLSPLARRKLEEIGVIIIKDSSANKGGVICSSYEILCGLVLTEEEFLKHKKQLVAEILEAVERCAFQEGQLLLKIYETSKTYLTDASDRISEKINAYTDQLYQYFEKITLPQNPRDPLVRCILNYAPRLLRERFSERLLKQLPENHKKAIIASFIASQLIYRNGLQWEPTVVDILPLILQEKQIVGDQ